MSEQLARPSRLTRILRVKELGIIIAVVAVYVAFAIYRPQYFATEANAINIVYFGGPLALVALGVTMILVVAEVDLSVGSVYALTACFFALIVKYNYVNIWEGLVLTLILGAILGLINGIATIRTGIPSLIITLGTNLVYASIGYTITGGSSVVFMQPPLFERSFGGFLIGSRTQLPGVPTLVLWMAGGAIVLWVLLNKTKFGNWQIAVGDRPWAALTSGIPVARVKILSFMLCSICVTIASIITLSQLVGISPTEGTLLPFQGIGASVIGGTSLFGGSGAVVGAILGGVLIGMIQNGISVIGVNVFYYEFSIGAVIIIAALINIVLKSRGERA